MRLLKNLKHEFLEILPPLIKCESFMEANRHFMAGTVWPHFWLIQMWMVVLFFVYCACANWSAPSAGKRSSGCFSAGEAQRISTLPSSARSYNAVVWKKLFYPFVKEESS